MKGRKPHQVIVDAHDRGVLEQIAHSRTLLKWFHQRHHHLRGAFLIQDGDPSHTAAQTKNYFQLTPW